MMAEPSGGEHADGDTGTGGAEAAQAGSRRRGSIGAHRQSARAKRVS